MRNPDTMLRIYEELANRFVKQVEPRFRDHCLVLAADAALTADRPADADRLRLRLLQFNPHHLLRPFASMAEAMQAPDVQEYVTDLRRQWPPEFAQKLYLSGGDPNGPVEPAPKSKPTEVPRHTVPGAKDEPSPQRETPATPASEPAVALPAPQPRQPAAVVQTARPVPAVAAPVGPVRAAAPPDRPALPQTSTLASGLAIAFLLLGIAGGVGLFLLAFIWPLLD
jgi:hypothetical protein